MAVEKISDFLQSGSGSSLRRIFLAHQIQTAIKKDLGEDVVAILTTSQVKIKCQSPAQSAFFNGKKFKLSLLVEKIVGSKIRLVIGV
jgi:hypothetical protein